MAASVLRFAPVVRNEGKVADMMVPAAQWVDALVLAAATAQSYTLPTGTDLSRGGSMTVNPPPGGAVTAQFLKVTNTTASPVYFNAQATAAVPTVNITTGLGPVAISANSFLMFQVPLGVASLSFISTPGGVVTIEAWW